MKNNVLCTLAADITAVAASLTVTPLNATAFVIPPGGTDATGTTTGGTKTYGEPIITAMIIDRLDASQAKMEIVKLTTYTAPGGVSTFAISQRGAEGTAAQAWTAGALIVTPPTAELIALRMQTAMLRAGMVAVHKRDGLMTWDGTSFKFDTFRFGNVGRGDHWSTDGRYTVAMPANAKVIVGYGGAANITVASGVIALPENQTLFYELNINAANTDADTGDRFRVVGTTTDFIVPAHWLFIAAHSAVTAGDACLRVCNGATMFPWIAPGFTNAWVNFGGTQQVAGYMKDAAGFVHLRGVIKTGTSGLSAFTLPAGFRPQSPASGDLAFACISNGALGQLYVTVGGNVVPTGSNVIFYLDGVRFLAGA